MKIKKRVFWMNLVLVLALIVGLALPAISVSAASKEKRHQRKSWLFIFLEQELQEVQQRRLRRQQVENSIRLKRQIHIHPQT